MKPLRLPPLRLRRNLTPPSRTPWGGHRIAELKGVRVEGVVGESWEYSMEPDFPSVVEGGGPLGELVADEGLLVKLLDSQQRLSLQIHPPHGHPDLADGECGKHEAWVVLASKPGAGLYVGLQPGVNEADMRAAVAAGAVEPLLNFVEVEPGDVLEVGPGTPHAVGEGLLLLEPQRLQPGHRGVTWRYWDWNRRFEGGPRTLHLEQALSVTNWGEPPPVPVRFGPPSVEGPAVRVRLVEGPVRVDRLAGSGSVDVGPGSLTVLAGSVSLDGVRAVAGETLAVRQYGAATLVRAHAVSCGA
mgnify:CR=1 FL=1